MILSRLKFSLRRLQEKLWIKPLGYALVGVAVVFVAALADWLPLSQVVPNVSAETVEKLLTVISASMLGVATFAVASMVSAYASASGRATPRAFVLVVSDSFSQTALSSFIGAFIFSIVGIVAIKIEYFAIAGRFALFLFTLAIFAWVVFTFVRWVDNIARLGRLENTIDRVERATREAFAQWPPEAPLGARPDPDPPRGGLHLYGNDIGFVQHVDVRALQHWGEKYEATVHLRSPPGALVSTDRPLLTVKRRSSEPLPDIGELLDAFVFGARRNYALDPRFGLVVMSEIASRALSPAVNDPGTAIDIVVRMSRLLREWNRPRDAEQARTPDFDRVYASPLSPRDLMEDCFAAVAKDGVASVEVNMWVQKMLGMLVRQGTPDLAEAAKAQAVLALARAERELRFPPDLARVREAHAAAMAPPPYR